MNRAAFRAWVLDLLDHAEVLSPPELRADMVGVARRRGERQRPPARERVVSRPMVGPRLQRVLALVPWILAHPGVTLDELAARFDVAERELERDLELLPMCGLPPYTADRLIDVSMIDGDVDIRLAEYFERPLRLTPAEGLALLAAGRALLAVPGSDSDGPLATALDKLDDVLGAPGSLAVDVGASDHLERLQDAAAHDERVEIDYYSFARDEMTHACHRPVARVPRVRRVVRRRMVPPRERRAAVPGRPRPRGARHRRALRSRDPRRRRACATSCTTRAPTTRGSRSARARGRLGRGELPARVGQRRKDGSWDVVLAVSEPAWLERLLVGLAPTPRL